MDNDCVRYSDTVTNLGVPSFCCSESLRRGKQWRHWGGIEGEGVDRPG